jgi:hypothetical protein
MHLSKNKVLRLLKSKNQTRKKNNVNNNNNNKNKNKNTFRRNKPHFNLRFKTLRKQRRYRNKKNKKIGGAPPWDNVLGNLIKKLDSATANTDYETVIKQLQDKRVTIDANKFNEDTDFTQIKDDYESEMRRLKKRLESQPNDREEIENAIRTKTDIFNQTSRENNNRLEENLKDIEIIDKKITEIQQKYNEFKKRQTEAQAGPAEAQAGPAEAAPAAPAGPAPQKKSQELEDDLNDQSEANKRMQNLQTTNVELNMLADTLIRDLQANEKMLDNTQKENESMIKDYERQIQVLNQQIQDLNDELKNKPEEKQEDDLDRLTKQLMIIEELKRNSKTLSEKIVFQIETNSKLQNENTELKNRIDNGDNNFRNLQDNLNNLQLKNQDLVERLKSQNKEKDEMINDFNELMEKLKEKNKQERIKDFDTLSQKFLLINEQSTNELKLEHKKRLDILLNRIHSLTDDNIEKLSQQRLANTTINAKNSEIQNLQSQLTISVSNYEGFLNENQNLREKEQEYLNEIKNLQDMNNKLHLRIIQLLQEKDIDNEIIGQLRTDLEKISKEKENLLTVDMANLNYQIQELKNQLEKKEIKMNKAQERLKNIAKENFPQQKLELETALRNQYFEMSSIAAEIQIKNLEKIQELENKLRQKEDEIILLNQKPSSSTTSTQTDQVVEEKQKIQNLLYDAQEQAALDKAKKYAKELAFGLTTTTPLVTLAPSAPPLPPSETTSAPAPLETTSAPLNPSAPPLPLETTSVLLEPSAPLEPSSGFEPTTTLPPFPPSGPSSGPTTTAPPFPPSGPSFGPTTTTTTVPPFSSSGSSFGPTTTPPSASPISGRLNIGTGRGKGRDVDISTNVNPLEDGSSEIIIKILIPPNAQTNMSGTPGDQIEATLRGIKNIYSGGGGLKKNKSKRRVIKNSNKKTKNKKQKNKQNKQNIT